MLVYWWHQKPKTNSQSNPWFSLVNLTTPTVMTLQVCVWQMAHSVGFWGMECRSYLHIKDVAAVRSNPRAEWLSRKQWGYTPYDVLFAALLSYFPVYQLAVTSWWCYTGQSPDPPEKAFLAKTIWHPIIIQSNSQTLRAEPACHVTPSDMKSYDKTILQNNITNVWETTLTPNKM